MRQHLSHNNRVVVKFTATMLVEEALQLTIHFLLPCLRVEERLLTAALESVPTFGLFNFDNRVAVVNNLSQEIRLIRIPP